MQVSNRQQAYGRGLELTFLHTQRADLWVRPRTSKGLTLYYLCSPESVLAKAALFPFAVFEVFRKKTFQASNQRFAPIDKKRSILKSLGFIAKEMISGDSMLHVTFSNQPQNSNRLDMSRLWEQVKPSDAIQNILLPEPLVLCRLQYNPHISGLSVYVTADVDHRLAPEGQQLLDEFVVAPFTRGVDKQNRLVRREFSDGLEDGRCVTSSEGDFISRDIVKLRIACCKLD